MNSFLIRTFQTALIVSPTIYKANITLINSPPTIYTVSLPNLSHSLCGHFSAGIREASVRHYPLLGSLGEDLDFIWVPRRRCPASFTPRNGVDMGIFSRAPINGRK